MMNEIKRKVIFYVDGFNFYHGLRSKGLKKFYWLDMVKFAEAMLKPHQQLEELNYFSAIPRNNDGKQERQDLFFSANRRNPRFNLHLGKYLEKKVTCFKCNRIINTYEEKQTDVCIAVKMIRNVVLQKCNISILVSADSDLLPAIDFIREFDPKHKIFVYFPPGRFSFDLDDKADKAIKLDNHLLKFEKALLPDEIPISEDFSIKKPQEWQ